MITFSTLENISIQTVTGTFNAAFSDYFIPLQLTKEQMAIKLKSEDFAPQYSVGAFYKNNLVGIILHCYRTIDGNKCVYNGGTGVIPSQRGQHLTIAMYDFIIPKLQQNGINKVILEVIEHNIQALKSYKKTGFKQTRRLRSYQGKIKILNCSKKLDIKIIHKIDWTAIENFWSIRPSWQNDSASLQNIQENIILIGAFQHDRLIGYSVYNPTSKRLQQIAVANQFRSQGIGRALLTYIAKNYSEDIALINVDDSHNDTIEFLEKFGLQNSINLLEMELMI
ncbi:MAG: GNAT family N-acetyltransferase [Sphingobacterium composti]